MSHLDSGLLSSSTEIGLLARSHLSGPSESNEALLSDSPRGARDLIHVAASFMLQIEQYNYGSTRKDDLRSTTTMRERFDGIS